MAGHWLWLGCGSEVIVCGRLSLLRKVTLWPTEIVTLFGVTPFAPIVIVAPLRPGPPESGASGFPLLLLLLPQPSITRGPARASTFRIVEVFIGCDSKSDREAVAATFRVLHQQSRLSVN